MKLAAYVLGLWLCASVTSADDEAFAVRSGVDEQLGARLPLDLQVTDQRGRVRTLRELLNGDKPGVLSLAYYHCPGLCDISLRELGTSLRKSGFRLGKDYRALTISIDPRDTPAAAAAKRANLLNLLRQGGDDDWPFAIATPAALATLTRVLGYRYAYDANSKEYAHPAVSMLLTPEGQIARYLYGPGLELSTLQLALREARAGRFSAAALIDRAILSCFKFDPSSHRYQWLISGVIRGGAALFALLLAAAVLVFARIGRRRRSAAR